MKKTIYLLTNSIKESFFSIRIIIGINEEKCEINYLCTKIPILSGSPLINLLNNKVN